MEEKHSMAQESRRFVECLDYSCLLQVTEEPAGGGGVLDFVPTNKKELVGNVKLKASLSFSDQGGV